MLSILNDYNMAGAIVLTDQSLLYSSPSVVSLLRSSSLLKCLRLEISSMIPVSEGLDTAARSTCDPSSRRGSSTFFVFFVSLRFSCLVSISCNCQQLSVIIMKVARMLFIIIIRFTVTNENNYK